MQFKARTVANLFRNNRSSARSSLKCENRDGDALGSSIIITFSALITLPAHKIRVEIHLWGQRWEISRNEMKKFSILVDKAPGSVVWLSMSMTMSHKAVPMISIIGLTEMNAIDECRRKRFVEPRVNCDQHKPAVTWKSVNRISDLCFCCLYLNNHLLSLIQLNCPLRLIRKELSWQPLWLPATNKNDSWNNKKRQAAKKQRKIEKEKYGIENCSQQIELLAGYREFKRLVIVWWASHENFPFENIYSGRVFHRKNPPRALHFFIIFYASLHLNSAFFHVQYIGHFFAILICGKLFMEMWF